MLLVSNSTNHGEGYLDHCMSEMRERFAPERVDVRGVTPDARGVDTLAWADAVLTC